MSEGKKGRQEQDNGKASPYRLRLPGFIRDEDIGLGDAVKKATYAMGVYRVDKGVVPQIWPNPIYGCHVIDGVFFCYPPHLVMPLTYAG